MIAIRPPVGFTRRQRVYCRLRQFRSDMVESVVSLLQREVGRYGVFVPEGRSSRGMLVYRSPSRAVIDRDRSLIHLYEDEVRRVYT